MTAPPALDTDHIRAELDRLEALAREILAGVARLRTGEGELSELEVESESLVPLHIAARRLELRPDTNEIICFSRGYTTKAEYVRARLFNWNNGAPFSLLDEQTQFVDTVADLGEIEGNRDKAYPFGIHFGFDSTDGRIMLQAAISATDSDNGDLPHTVYFSWFSSVTSNAELYGCPGSLSEGTFDDTVWDIPDLEPLNMGILKHSAPISGGSALAGHEPAESSGNGFWEIVLNQIPIVTRAEVLYFREIEAKLTGRIGVAILHFCDGKRAPWPAGGGSISAEASGDFMPGDTSGSIDMIAGTAPLAGMHFSTDDRMYRIVSVGSPTGSIYPVTIWPKVRELILDQDTLYFDDLKMRVRLKEANAMHLALENLRIGFPTVSFVEDVLPGSGTASG